MSNPFDLSGQVALVTGASRGIGEAIARRLASAGAMVIVSSRKLEASKQTADSIVESGGRAEAYACHVGDMDDIAAIFSWLRDRFGRLDILVNNAATNPYYGDILDTGIDAFQKTIDVNVRGYFYMSVEAGKIMRDQGGGAILNTASVAGIQPSPGQGIYAISKAAVINMTRAFAGECGKHNIRVNALLPGLTKTAFASALFEDPDFYQEAIKGIPLARHAEPEEMAGMALAIVSGAGAYLTGQTITVDGGMTSTRL